MSGIGNSVRGHFNRRNALLMSLAVGALSGRWLSVPGLARDLTQIPTLDPNIPRLLIDAHCHVFNAHDIPVKRFIIETAVRESPDLKPWVGVASLLAWLIRFWVGITDHEVSLVDFPSARPPTPNRDLEERDFHGLVGNSVARVASEAAGGVEAQRAAEVDPFTQTVMKYGMQRAPELFQTATRSAPLALNLSAVGMNFLLGHYGHGELRHAETGARLGELSSGDVSGVVRLSAANDQVRDLTDSLVADSKAQTTDVGSIMNLAKIISRSRLRNIEVLDESLGVAAASPPITRLYVPALVDFDCWYGDPSGSLEMWKQTSIMGKLAKRQSDPNRFANGYVPFDPLRAVLVENGVVADLNRPLDVVRNAIETEGFLGAKLYPPMGFRAWNNTEIENEQFGDHVKPWIDKLVEKTGDASFQLGKAIDGQLEQLFSYCLAGDVPIMAHCSDSQTSFSGSGERASPAYWLKLLDQSDPATGASYAKLRVNLGHFGSVWCHAGAEGDPANPDSEAARCQVAYGWPDLIMQAVTPSTAGQPARCPNLYFDLSDLGVITQNAAGGNWLKQLLESRTQTEQDAILSRLIYGTDWMFLVLFGKTHVQYIDSVYGLIADRPGAVEKVFHQNAARFLGLTQDGRTAQRLRAFYADDPDRLARFEQLVI